MKKIPIHIEIVRSTVPGLSSISQLSCDAVYATLVKHYESVGVSIINNKSDLDTLVRSRPDLVFLCVKFLPHSEGAGILGHSKLWLSSYLEDHGIRHTSSSAQAIAYEQDKSRAKRRVRQMGLKTADSFVARRSLNYSSPSLPVPFPLFVKPTNLGGAKGIDSKSVVHTYQDLRSKVTSIRNEFNTDSLVESFLSGREFSVAILRHSNQDEYMAMPLELVAPKDIAGNLVLSKVIKTEDLETVLLVSDPVLREKVSSFAIHVFKALGARNYGRIDIRMDENGNPNFIEANLIPGLIEGQGYFPKACLLNMGMDYQSMLLTIVELALETDMHAQTQTLNTASYPTFSSLQLA